MNQTQRPNQIDRAPRLTSHALVEVRKFKLLPFFADSAVLLDLSHTGFKLEFTGEVESRNGTKYWLVIPLRPLGILAPEKLVIRCECKWFDEARFRIGGVFIGLTNQDRMVISQVLDALKSRGMVPA